MDPFFVPELEYFSVFLVKNTSACLTEHYETCGLILSFVLPGLYFCLLPGSGTMQDYPHKKSDS